MNPALRAVVIAVIASAASSCIAIALAVARRNRRDQPESLQTWEGEGGRPLEPSAPEGPPP